MTLGRLAAHAKLDPKARGYFEKCITLRGPAEAYRELGAVLERMGEVEKALACYRRGLEAYADEQRPVAARPGLGLAPLRAVK